MRIVVRETDNEGAVIETAILWFRDDADIDVEIVEEDEPHWCHSFNTRPHTVKSLRSVIVEDQQRRRLRHVERQQAAEFVGGIVTEYV